MTKKKTRKPKAALITVDGVDAAAVLAEARSALGSGARGGISRWDASGVFQELAVADEAAGRPSARTLLLLYAADLAFRLRWQIRPILDEGNHVIAAPYVETVVGFGRAAGLSHAWLRRLFAFAPAPDVCYRVPESTIPASRRGKPSDSFLEFCLAQLRNGPAQWDAEEIRRGFLYHLDRLEARGKCTPATASASAASR